MEGSSVVEPTQGLARNALGLNQVLFCIVTGAAPIAAMLFNDPWAVFGGGWAAPSAFIIATVDVRSPSRSRRSTSSALPSTSARATAW